SSGIFHVAKAAHELVAHQRAPAAALLRIEQVHCCGAERQIERCCHGSLPRWNVEDAASSAPVAVQVGSARGSSLAIVWQAKAALLPDRVSTNSTATVTTWLTLPRLQRAESRKTLVLRLPVVICREYAQGGPRSVERS